MKRRGRGMACMWYPIGFTVAANPSAAVVKVNEDGTATLLTGTVETGQGSLTILAQIVAQELGIATEDVHVVSADTDATPMDTGAIASRTTYVTGNAARLAAEKAKLMLFDVAAAGRAAILVPFPHATGDHQLHNARFFTQKGAAELLMDSEVTAAALRGHVEALLEDDERRELLAGRIRGLATPGAADEIATRLLLAAEREDKG